MTAEELAEAREQGQDKLLVHDENAGKQTCTEMTHFLDCIASSRQPETNLSAGIQSLRTIWRLYEAERRGIVADLSGLALDAFSPEPDPIMVEARKFGHTTNLAELMKA